MNFLGNYKDWIRQDIVDYLINNEGTRRPNVGKNPNVQEFITAKNVGYDLSTTWWHIYEPETVPFTIDLPIETNRKSMWWFIKLLPGGMMPMHRDPHVNFDDVNAPDRYWMPLQNYEPGHVFIYKDTMIKDYNVGDLWKYDNENEVHGACNISYKPRLTFLFTLYD